MKKIIILSTVVLFLLISIPVVAKGKDEAPGQIKKEENTQSNSNVGGPNVTIGSVGEVKKNSIVVDEKKGNKKTEGIIDATTKIVGQDKKEVKIGAIKLKDIIALISTESAETATGSGKFKVKKIFVKQASESAQIKRRAVQGVIVDISGNTITVAHQIQRDRQYTVIVTPETIIKFKSQVSKGSEASASPFASVSPIATASPTATSGAALAETTASSTSLAVGQRIVAMGDLNPDGGIIAKLIHIIPGKATGIFKRLPVATPSASLAPTGTPAASLSPSSTPSATPVASVEPLPSP